MCIIIQIDVFSFGMFVYELVALLKPFELYSEQPTELILRQLRPIIPETAKVHEAKMCVVMHLYSIGKLHSMSYP